MKKYRKGNPLCFVIGERDGVLRRGKICKVSQKVVSVVVLTLAKNKFLISVVQFLKELKRVDERRPSMQLVDIRSSE